jgi:multiple sugar transport system substrate-binding protein
MKRSIFLASLFVGLALTSCGGDDQPVRNARTIRMWQFWSDAGQRAVLDSLIDIFEREHECTVEVTNLLWNDGKAKLQAAFNSGAPPDVVELGSDWIAQFSSAGVLLPLEPPSDSSGTLRFISYTLAPAMWNDRIYAYPWTIDTRVMYANADLLHRAGWTREITSMEDLLGCARAVQGMGEYGFGANGADRHRLYKKILPMMWSYGGDVFDAQGRPTLNAAQNVRALTMYVELARTGFVETQRQIDAAFLQGRVGLWNSGSWILPKLAANPNLRYRIVPMPGVDGRPGVSFAGGEYLAVSAKAGNKQLARALVDYLTSGKVALGFCAAVTEAGFPADKAFARHPSISADARRAAFAAQLEHARMTPVHPRWLDIEEVLEDAVVEVLYGNRTPQQALDEAQQEVLQIVNAP